MFSGRTVQRCPLVIAPPLPVDRLRFWKEPARLPPPDNGLNLRSAMGKGGTVAAIHRRLGVMFSGRVVPTCSPVLVSDRAIVIPFNQTPAAPCDDPHLHRVQRWLPNIGYPCIVHVFEGAHASPTAA
jgi:hypothetical protein